MQILFSIPTQNKHGKGNKVKSPGYFPDITKHMNLFIPIPWEMTWEMIFPQIHSMNQMGPEWTEGNGLCGL